MRYVLLIALTCFHVAACEPQEWSKFNVHCTITLTMAEPETATHPKRCMSTCLVRTGQGMSDFMGVTAMPCSWNGTHSEQEFPPPETPAKVEESY